MDDHLLFSRHTAQVVGQTISHYRILNRLGSGGMGVVYEAQDLTLGRRVALKFLPPDVAKDQVALDRFLLEARAASALNHPNICTIYAVENDANQSFISMELLEGQSLDRRLETGPLPLDRLLDISLQLADALDAAHVKGIVHRDIKPANIFITQRGQVKVLDFGLAKLTKLAELGMETTTASIAGPAPLTSPGSTVGTVAYMSPEQARGQELDHRSDLFSLGTVIYLMSTGRLPFPGNTSAVVFSAILEREPVPPLEINPALPPKLQETITKLLEKDRDLRYQSAADLRGDLKRLKRDSESGRRISQASTVSTSSAAAPSSGVRTETSKAVATARQHKIVSSTAAVLAALILAAAAYGIYALLHRPEAAPFQNISIKKVTDTGKAALVAISPDAKYILNVVNEEGQQSLWLRNLPTNSNTQVVPAADVEYSGLRFSPDGNYLYFVRTEPGSHELSYLYRAPVLGGTPQKLVTDIDSNITFSPDGQRFAFLRYNSPEPGKYRVLLLPIDGGQERVLYNASISSALYNPAWSPDGTKLAFNVIQPANAFGGLTALDIASGKQRLFFSSDSSVQERLAWMPNGYGLLALSGLNITGPIRNQIVFVSYPEGRLVPITRDTNYYADLSLSADGHALATVSREPHLNLFTMPAASSGMNQLRQVSSGAPHHFTWTADSQLITESASGLNVINPKSGTVAPLPTPDGPYISGPSACGDGKSITFTAIVKGKPVMRLWRMDAGGGNARELSDGRLQDFSVCSRDGRWVIFEDGVSGGQLMKMPASGGKAEQISDDLVIPGFDISADSKLVAFASFVHEAEHKEELQIMDLNSNRLVKSMDFQRARSGPIRFSSDGKAVVYPVHGGAADNLWAQPLDGSTGKQITNFTSERIIDFHWSFDGKQLGLIRGHTDSDVVLIRDMEK
jgi:eukaryotic-like serine/threonine-protein kinase